MRADSSRHQQLTAFSNARWKRRVGPVASARHAVKSKGGKCVLPSPCQPALVWRKDIASGHQTGTAQSSSTVAVRLPQRFRPKGLRASRAPQTEPARPSHAIPCIIVPWSNIKGIQETRLDASRSQGHLTRNKISALFRAFCLYVVHCQIKETEPRLPGVALVSSNSNSSYR